MAAASTSSGFGRVLVATYGVFAISATARALYQLFTKFAEAPFAYSLSAAAAVIYIVATYALAREHQRLAWVTVGVELIGVLAVGAWSFAQPAAFAEPTVWSHFGEGYGYIPLVLPMIGVWWLGRTRSAHQS